MELRYLWDTNTVIYYLQKNYAEARQELLNKIINNYTPAISAISQIELLCWKAASEIDLLLLKSFINDCLIFELEEDIKEKTIEIKKDSNLKLPDAIIAATAIVKGLTLISNDKRGLKNIDELKLLNPTEVE